MSEPFEKIRITADDLENIRIDAPSGTTSPIGNPADVGGPRQWGSISGAPTEAINPGEEVARGSFFLKSWVYLGLAGFAAALLAWGICEPGFLDDGDGPGSWGNILLFPLLVTGMSLAFAIAESTVERSLEKGITRGLLALVIGLILGFVFSFGADLIYAFGLRIALSAGEPSASNPALWLARSIAWMVFGISGGLIYGIAGRSAKKCLFGVLGGLLGAGLGGLVFDPISLLTDGGAASRCVGMMIIGASTGVAIGLVENALKNRWLYVSGGPLAGKQFILYKPVTLLGSLQANDIYLFKDPSIAPSHATIQLRGSHATLFASGPTYVGGQQVTQRTLRSGDLIQIGRYTFQYQEKQAEA
jgi:hypothetical protein